MSFDRDPSCVLIVLKQCKYYCTEVSTASKRVLDFRHLGEKGLTNRRSVLELRLGVTAIRRQNA